MTHPDGEGSGPANGQQVTMFTQEQVNYFVANAKREAVSGYFRAAGLDKAPAEDALKGILADAAEHQKTQAGQKTDVERLTAELADERAKAGESETLKAQLLRTQIAGDAGLKSRYHKYVEGDDKESIEASIKAILADIKVGSDGGGDNGGDGSEPPADDTSQQQQNGRTGTGSLAPNPQQGAGNGTNKPPKATLSSGREAYEAKHGKKE